MNDQPDALRDFELAIRSMLDQQRATGLSALDQVRDAQVTMRVLLQHEARRIEKKHGKDHPRSRRLAARLKSNLETVQALEVEREIARVEVPAVGEQEALVHGRVVDANRRGIAGLTVSLSDSRGKPIPNIAAAATDRSGYYAVPLAAAAIEALKTFRAGVFLAVLNSEGQVLFRGSDPLRIEAGARRLVRVSLERRRPAAEGPRRAAANRKSAAAKAKAATAGAGKSEGKPARARTARKKKTRPKK